jgi:hypothetical protein
MKQRFIIVPKDEEAENALDFDEAKDNQLIKLILQDPEFYKLYEEGLFVLINQVGNVNIDDYEDECIKDRDAINNVIKSLSIRETLVSEEIKPLFIQIKQMFEEGLRRRTGIYFFF